MSTTYHIFNHILYFVFIFFLFPICLLIFLNFSYLICTITFSNLFLYCPSFSSLNSLHSFSSSQVNFHFLLFTTIAWDDLWCLPIPLPTSKYLPSLVQSISNVSYSVLSLRSLFLVLIYIIITIS